MDRGPRTGVTEGVSKSDLDLVIGGGAAGRRALRLGSAVYLIGRWRRWGGFTYYFGNAFVLPSHKTHFSMIFYGSGFGIARRSVIITLTGCRILFSNTAL